LPIYLRRLIARKLPLMSAFGVGSPSFILIRSVHWAQAIKDSRGGIIAIFLNLVIDQVIGISWEGLFLSIKCIDSVINCLACSYQLVFTERDNSTMNWLPELI